jgi:hypothetical protein
MAQQEMGLVGAYSTEKWYLAQGCHHLREHVEQLTALPQ